MRKEAGIVIVDYGMGNLRSVQKGLEKVGYLAKVSAEREVIASASALVLPGVGAFARAMHNLQDLGLLTLIREHIEWGKPFLGICLGLQLLFSESEEDGLHKGLDVIKGRVKRLPVDLKVPHMGWNQIRKQQKDCKLLAEVPDSSFMYFVHSYYVQPEDEEVITTVTDYGIDFTSMICRDNIFGMQFHPEKSQKKGLTILRRFGSLVEGAGKLL